MGACMQTPDGHMTRISCEDGMLVAGRGGQWQASNDTSQYLLVDQAIRGTRSPECPGQQMMLDEGQRSG